MNREQLQKVRAALKFGDSGFFHHPRQKIFNDSIAIIDAEMAKPDMPPALPAKDWVDKAEELFARLDGSSWNDNNFWNHIRARVEPAPNEWQPIETAPKDDGVPVLLWLPTVNRGSSGIECAQRWCGEWWTNGGPNAGSEIPECNEATHWMELPSPPKEPTK